jgi:hypothetical protein
MAIKPNQAQAQIKGGAARGPARNCGSGDHARRAMRRLLLTIGLAALLALSAPAEAEPMIGGPDGQTPDQLGPAQAGERWFFGDGGFGCPPWWCGDAGRPPQRPPQHDPGERWFFGDGGFGCPPWWCGDRPGVDTAGGD